MYAPTAGAARAPRPVRARAKISARRNVVATTSASRWPPLVRSLVDTVVATPNMRLASTAPATAPATWATAYPPTSPKREPVPGTPSQEPVSQGDDRVEVRPRHRTEQQDQHRQPEEGRGAVLQQLQPDIVRGQLLGGDSRPDHDRDQQGAAQELGQQAPTDRRPGGLGHGAILTGRRQFSQT